MKISVYDRRREHARPVNCESLEKCLVDAAAELPFPEGIIELTLVDDEQIQDLNRRYRDLDRPTNVLAFPMVVGMDPDASVTWPTVDPDGPPIHYGDVIVSVDTVARQSAEAGVPFVSELFRICIHGVLHLFGYDHEAEEDERRMAAREARFQQWFEQRNKRGECL